MNERGKKANWKMDGRRKRQMYYTEGDTTTFNLDHPGYKWFCCYPFSIYCVVVGWLVISVVFVYSWVEGWRKLSLLLQYTWIVASLILSVRCFAIWAIKKNHEDEWNKRFSETFQQEV